MIGDTYQLVESDELIDDIIGTFVSRGILRKTEKEVYSDIPQRLAFSVKMDLTDISRGALMIVESIKGPMN